MCVQKIVSILTSTRSNTVRQLLRSIVSYLPSLRSRNTWNKTPDFLWGKDSMMQPTPFSFAFSKSFNNSPRCLVHIWWCWLGSSQLICPGLWGWRRLGLQSEKPSHFSLHPTFSAPLPLYFTRWPIFVTHGGGVVFRSFILSISVQRCIANIPVRRLKLDKMIFGAEKHHVTQ